MLLTEYESVHLIWDAREMICLKIINLQLFRKGKCNDFCLRLHLTFYSSSHNSQPSDIILKRFIPVVSQINIHPSVTLSNTQLAIQNWYWFRLVIVKSSSGLSGDRTRLERDFPHPSRPTLGPTHPSVKGVPYLLAGGKVAWVWRWPRTSI